MERIFSLWEMTGLENLIIYKLYARWFICQERHLFQLLLLLKKQGARNKNFLIYPGKLTVADTFRIGCIGNLNAQDMKDTLVAVKEVISDLKINL